MVVRVEGGGCSAVVVCFAFVCFDLFSMFVFAVVGLLCDYFVLICLVNSVVYG